VITQSPSNYPYKAYITNCLSYSTVIKLSQLKAEGWYDDTPHHMGCDIGNLGIY